MAYSADDLLWLLTELQTTAGPRGEYMTWRRLVGRYPGQSNLDWLWKLLDAEVEAGYLAVVPGSAGRPEPDSQVTWASWSLTDQGRQLLGVPIATD